MRKILLTLLFFLCITALALPKEKLVIAGRDGGYGAALQIAVDLFMERNPDVKIELLKLPYKGLYEKLVIDLSAGIGAYDIVMLDDPWATEFMSLGWLASLEELGYTLDPDFVSPALAVCHYPYPDGVLYALPHVGNVELFAYRKDLFEKYGLKSPPETWADILQAVAVISTKEPGVHGVVFRGRKGNPIVTGFLPILWGFGADIVKDGEVVLNSREAVAALKFFLLLKQYAPEGVEIYNSSEVREALLAGDVAVAIEVWPAWVPDLDNPEKSKVVGKVEIIPAPGLVEKSSPMLGTWLLGISSASRNKELALKFLEFVTSAEVQKLLTLQVGHAPTRKSVLTDPEVVAKYRWFPNQLAALEAAVPRPRVLVWSEIEGILGEYLQLALIGELSPEEAIGEATQRIAEVLGG